MNRGVLQSSPVQQLMAGNPNWWGINNMRPPTLTQHHHHHQLSPASSISPPLPNSNNNNNLFLYQYSTSMSNTSSPTSSSSSSLPMPVAWSHDNPDQFPESWSQLLLGGFVGDEDKATMGQFQAKKLVNWEEQVLLHQAASSANSTVDVKQETSPASSYIYGHATHEDFSQQAVTKPANWSQIMPYVANSSPNSHVTSFNSNNNMLDFCTTATTNNNKADPRHPPPDRSSECNSNANGGVLKKARVQPSSTQSTFKVRKEKLGDRITALHQLVSPFGKTDTASVLLEAIGYIRFLQNQIEALSMPYLGSGFSNMGQQQPVQGERNNLFAEDPGQDEEPKKNLRSRGLCLVPVSCTLQVGSDNGADYWAPAFGGGFQ